MYCIKCGAELSEGQNICPLCETRVYHPDFKIDDSLAAYPRREFKSEEFNRKGLMFVITVLFLIPLLLPVILELSWHGNINWSGYVFGGILLFYVSFVLPCWFKHPNPAIFTPCAFSTAILYLFYICEKTGGEWFLGFAFPISLALAILFTAALTLNRYLKKGKLYISGGFFIALGIWTVLMDVLMRTAFDLGNVVYWSLCTLALFFIVGMLLIVIEIVKPIKESLRRVFFIG